MTGAVTSVDGYHDGERGGVLRLPTVLVDHLMRMAGSVDVRARQTRSRKRPTGHSASRRCANDVRETGTVVHLNVNGVAVSYGTTIGVATLDACVRPSQ